MRNRDHMDSELRLVAARRRRARDRHGPRPVDAARNEAIDERREERLRGVTRLETYGDSTDLGPLCW